MTLELNNAGSFEFTIVSSHPAISQIRKMKSQISVYHGNEEIFCGRVIEVKEDFYKRQKIFCEGELAYLNDSVQRPKKYQRMTVRGYLESLLSVHNAQVEDSKKFQVGAVTVTDPNDSIYRYTNWEKTMDVIKSDLIKSLGGYLFVRKENGIRYIDYLAELPAKSTQTVEFGKNLLDFTKNFDVTDLATAIIPLGAKINSSDTSDNPSVLEERLTIKDINNGNDFLFNQEAVNNYGWIFKTVIWDNVNTTTALKRKGEQYLASAQFENMTIEAKAIDMNFVDGSERLKLGELIRVVSVPHGLDKFFPLSKMTILLDKISQNTITLGLEVKTSLTSSNISTNDKIQQEIEKIPSHSDIIQEAVDNATQIINQKTTGYVTITGDELLVMDSKDKNTAQKVWRWNLNGLGYSGNGYKGSFTTAMTMDGQIVGERIVGGTITGEKLDIRYRQELDQKISSAENSANGYTDEKLNDYYTKSEVEQSISNSKDGILLEAKQYTTTQLQNYSTIDQMNAAIKVASDSINLSIEQSTSYNFCTNGNFTKGTDGLDGWEITNGNYPTVAVEQLGVMCLKLEGTATWNFTASLNKIRIKFKCHGDRSNHIDVIVNGEKIGEAKGNYNDFNSCIFDIDALQAGPISVKFIKKYGSDPMALIRPLYITDVQIIGNGVQGVNARLEILSNELVAEVKRATLGEEELSSKIAQTEKGINVEVNKKVGKNEIISTINQSAEKITISASKINFNGLVTANNYFKILTDGSMETIKGKIGNWTVGDNYIQSSNKGITFWSEGSIGIGSAKISAASQAITIKYGLHVYNDTDAFNDGSGFIKFFNLYHVSSGGHLVFDRDGVTLAYLSSSSKRYKDHVGDMTVADAEKVLDIPVVWFKYKDGYLRHDDILAGKAIPGFYAEDVEEYFPVAAQKNEDGSVEDWNYRMLIPAMMKLIQELYKRTGGITK